jgi:hypothetical protein
MTLSLLSRNSLYALHVLHATSQIDDVSSSSLKHGATHVFSSSSFKLQTGLQWRVQSISHTAPPPPSHAYCTSHAAPPQTPDLPLQLRPTPWTPTTTPNLHSTQHSAPSPSLSCLSSLSLSLSLTISSFSIDHA